MNRDECMTLAKAWSAVDPDPETVGATTELLESGREEELFECFGARLRFGTAGMRGALGPGPNRMNRVMVRWVSMGLAEYVRVRAGEAERLSAVIGFDGRKGSREFAADAADVLAAHGFSVKVYNDVVPTPELAHAVLYMKASVGILVTASHNPPGDNGYKVYWSDGGQIVPPHDQGISESIQATRHRLLEADGHLNSGVDSATISAVPAAARAMYIQRVLGLRLAPKSGVRVVYSAMHGVGCELVMRVMEEAGHKDVWAVPEQAKPDGAFPTVAFPNPEEPGAMDLAIALAKKVDADLVIANDPDADRLAVCVPLGDSTWRQLSGNEVGVLLACDLLDNHPRTDGRPLLVATTIVSSLLLAEVARATGVAYAETLTGFKWIAQEAMAFEDQGGQFLFGYEEALGYCVGPVVRDKDGVSAALLFCDLVARCKHEGISVLERLLEIYIAHGLYATSQRSLVRPGQKGADQISAIMNALRSAPPTDLAGQRVVRIRDVLLGESLDVISGAKEPIELPTSNVLAFDLETGSRVLVRPSGTEPKLKIYGQVRGQVGDGQTLASAENETHRELQLLLEAFFQFARTLLDE